MHNKQGQSRQILPLKRLFNIYSSTNYLIIQNQLLISNQFQNYFFQENKTNFYFSTRKKKQLPLRYVR